MSNREEALKAFKEHYAFPLDPMAWSAWKMAWDLAYRSGYNRGIDDSVGKFVSESDLIDHRTYEALEEVQKLKI